VAPEAYTEHPAWPAGYGARYTAGVLNALTSDPQAPLGSFRHFAGSPATVLGVEVRGGHDGGRLTLRLADTGDRRGRRPARSRIVVALAGAYGPEREIELDGSAEITIDTRHSGGWYDIALTTPTDSAFSYQLAGRLESAPA
jgi:hypothetical protein